MFTMINVKCEYNTDFNIYLKHKMRSFVKKINIFLFFIHVAICMRFTDNGADLLLSVSHNKSVAFSNFFCFASPLCYQSASKYVL